MARWTFIEKRNLTLFAFSTRMFFMGVEYAVIFPSVWLYLKIFHVEYWYLGLVLSAYNMVGIVSTALVGHLVDITRKARFTGFLWNLAEITGNFVYSLPFYVAFPLLGRMIAGFGEGFISAMWGELARVTTQEQRTRYFAILKGSNLLGAALGPAFNLFLKEIDFSIGSWRIDFRTSPGFVMGLFWILVTLLMLFCVFDLTRELQENPEYQLLIEESSSTLKPRKKKPLRHSSTRKGAKETRSSSPEVLPNLYKEQEKSKKTILSIAEEAKKTQEKEEKSVEQEKLDKQETLDEPEKPEKLDQPEKLGKQEKPVEYEKQEKQEERELDDFSSLPDGNIEELSGIKNSEEDSNNVDGEKRKNPFATLETDSSDSELDDAESKEVATFKSAFLDMFTKYHVVVLVYLLFFMYVIHTCLQGISPLVAERMLAWNETQLSLLYTAWGLEIILVLVVVWLIAPKIADRQILLFAVISGCFSSLSLLVLSYSTPLSELSFYSYILTVFLAGIGISVTVVIGRSLVSKHTKAVNQGLVHAILTSFNRIAGLSGPIFGSSLYVRMDIMAWILAFLQFTGLALLIFAYKKLKVKM